MLIILEAVEIMNSWMPFVSITVPVYAKLQRQSKPEPLNGSQRVKLGRRSMQTRLWASGAWMKSKVPSSTAPTMQSVSYVQKVWPWTFFFCLPLCSKKDLFFFCLLNFFFHNLSKITFQSTSIFFSFPQHITVLTFREPGDHGQTGAHVLPSVAKWGCNFAIEIVNLTRCCAVGQN